MNIVRDTILFVGPSASGKTHALNIARRLAKEHNVPFYDIPLTDSHTIIRRMLQDDDRGGMGHYHSWCKGRTLGHTHTNGEPTLPFTIASNEIAHGFIADFFEQLKEFKSTNQIHFAEWSGGININPKEEPASQTDLSFRTIARLLQSGKIPTEGLDRIIAVIHPKTERETRLNLNTARRIPSEEEIRRGSNSFPLSEEAMRIFGIDDFQEAQPIFTQHSIPIYTMINDGNNSLERELVGLAPLLFKEFSQGIESRSRRHKET